MASDGQACSAVCVPEQLAVAAASSASLFVNDDACGDWVVPLGVGGLEFQVVNAASAMLFVVAGAPLVWKAQASIARAYGLMMCMVGFGSFSYHATTSLSGFLIDIVPMAVTAALMVYQAVHALQASVGRKGPEAEMQRFVISMVSACVAVYIPWAMIVLGVSHSIVWGVWALLFGSMGAFFGVVALIAFAHEDLLFARPGADVLLAAASILFGLSFSVHSFIPGLCEGWRTYLSFHALWHLFSSFTSNRCGYIMDNLVELCKQMEVSPKPVTHSKGASGTSSLFWRMLRRDSMPSQFSM